MKKYPYDTLTLSGFDVKGISRPYINDNSRDSADIISVADYISCVIPNNTHVPPFNHTIPSSEYEGSPACGFDIRPYSRASLDEPYFIARDVAGVRLQMNRALLQVKYMEDPISLRSFNPLPLRLYIRMISDNVSRHFNLDLADLNKLNALAAIWYFSLFETVDKDHDGTNPSWTEREYAMIVSKIASQTKLRAEVLYEVNPHQTIITSPRAFFDLVTDAIPKHSLSGLNVAIFYSLVASFKRGPNSRENVAVGVEHPPTWIALVIESLAQRSDDPMNNALRLDNKDGSGDSLIMTVRRIAEDYDIRPAFKQFLAK